MKKAICLLLTCIFALGMLAGCGRSKLFGVLQADNEILTYRALDAAKTQLVVSTTGNIDIVDFCAAFEAQNPDVQIICIDITGGNSQYQPLDEWITRGYAPDVMLSASNFFGKVPTEYFENLSSNPVIQNYEIEALKRTAVDNEVYSLPGPSNISAMMYNKTLFERYGWAVPKTFDEFVSLCDRIREDTGGKVEPWNPNAKYSNELQIAIEAFTYEELFGGTENRAWYNEFRRGNATFVEHMEPYVEVLQTLIDHGILTEEHFSYSATTRGKEFEAGNIAMINFSIYDADNADFDFGYMPFPTTSGELGYLCDSYSCYIGIPVKEHTEEQSDAVQRFLEFFSSVEGQQLYIGNALKVSNVRGVPINQTDDLAALGPAIEAGHMFAMLNFASEATGAGMVDLHAIAADMAAGVMSGEECLKRADNSAAAINEAAPQQAEPAAEVAVAAEDMTVLETSFYIADAYREAAGADVGLIAHGLPYRGNVMRIFSGCITEGIVSVLKPRSFANDSTLIKASMTGAQLLQALNNPPDKEERADCIYAYSGLKCKVAPCNELGARYISVKLADGQQLEENKLYTVAFWGGTVAEEYLTETLETYNASWEDILLAKLGADKTVAPADDKRIELVWE